MDKWEKLKKYLNDWRDDCVIANEGHDSEQSKVLGCIIKKMEDYDEEKKP